MVDFREMWRTSYSYLGSLALILPPVPCSAVRNLECIKAGFGDGCRMR